MEDNWDIIFKFNRSGAIVDIIFVSGSEQRSMRVSIKPKKDKKNKKGNRDKK